MRTIQIRSNPVGEAVMNASRQVWLASLGAAVVTREWAQSEAGAVFRILVKEGSAVESRTIRLVGDRIEGSVAMANSFWKQARTTVKQAADTAVTLVQNNLPKALPKVTLPAMLAPATTRKASKRTARKTRVAKTKTRATKSVKRGKRSAKAATRK